MSSSVDRFGERRVDSVRGRPGGGSRSRSRSPRGGGSPSSFGTGGVVVPGFKLGTRRCSECGLSGKSNRFADEEWDAPRETRVCLSCAEGGGGGAGGGAGGSRVSPLGGRTGASARSARAPGTRRRVGTSTRDPRGLARTLLPGVLPPAPYDAYSISSRGGDASLDPDGGGDFGEGVSPRRRRSITTRAVRARTTTPLGFRAARAGPAAAPAGRGARRFPCWTRTGRRLSVRRPRPARVFGSAPPRARPIARTARWRTRVS